MVGRGRGRAPLGAGPRASISGRAAGRRRYDPGVTFDPVAPSLDLVALEHAALDRWDTDDVFAESLRRRAGAPEWVFYEGPPTANGRPGIHHVWARLFKDLYPRFQTMRGRHVARKGGLGLPRPAGRGPGREGARLPQQARDRGLRDRRVQPAVPRVGAPLRGRLRVAHQAHRHVARHRRRLLDARQLVHRERVVAVPPDVGQRRHLRGPQGRPLLRPLRHRAVEPRARPARRVPGRHRAVGVRALPRRRPRLRPPRVDDHAVDAGVERRRRGRSRRRVRARARAPTVAATS